MLGTVPTLYRLDSKVSVLIESFTALEGQGRSVWLVEQAQAAHAPVSLSAVLSTA